MSFFMHILTSRKDPFLCDKSGKSFTRIDVKICGSKYWIILRKS